MRSSKKRKSWNRSLEYHARKAAELKERRALNTQELGAEVNVVKAVSMPPVARDKSSEIDEAGGDAIYRIVNHAHQRDPRRKW